jgi:hypothetical protein
MTGNLYCADVETEKDKKRKQNKTLLLHRYRSIQINRQYPFSEIALLPGIDFQDLKAAMTATGSGGYSVMCRRLCEIVLRIIWR